MTTTPVETGKKEARSNTRRLVFALRLLLLPLDFLLFSVDFLRLSAHLLFAFWLRLRKWGTPLTNAEGPVPVAEVPYQPCLGTKELVIGGKSLRRCGMACKYFNPFIFRLLCRDLRTAWGPRLGLVGHCASQSCVRVSPALFVVLGLLLVAAWIGIGAKAVQAYRSVRARVQVAAVRQPPAVPPVMPAFLTQKTAAEEASAYESARLEFLRVVQRNPHDVAAWIALAQCAMQFNQRTDARNAFAQVLRIDPAHARANRGMVELALAANRVDDAVKQAHAFCTAAPDSLEARLLLVHCLRTEGSLEMALLEAQTAVMLAPNDPAGYLAAATTAAAAGKIDDATQWYMQAAERSTDAGPWLNMARMQRDQGKDAEALASFLKAREADPANPESLLSLAELLVRNGRLQAAIDACQSFVERYPHQLGVRARLAGLLLAAGRRDDGQRMASAVLEIDPAHAGAHVMLAELALLTDTPTVAVHHCRQALQRSSGDARASRILVRALMELGAVDEAVRELTALLLRHPDDLEFRLRLGRLCIQLGRRDEALDQFREAAARHADSALPLLMIALLHQEAKQQADAIRVYRQALEKDPDQPVALNNLARLLLENSGDLDESLELAARAHRRSPDSPLVADTLGWIHYQRGDARSAVGLLAFAAAKLPRDPSVRTHYGAALYAEGLWREAARELDAAAALAPGLKSVEQLAAMRADIQRRLAATE